MRVVHPHDVVPAVLVLDVQDGEVSRPPVTQLTLYQQNILKRFSLSRLQGDFVKLFKSSLNRPYFPHRQEEAHVAGVGIFC